MLLNGFHSIADALGAIIYNMVLLPGLTRCHGLRGGTIDLCQ